MNVRKFGLAVIAYVVVTFVIAAGWHLVLFKDVYDQFGIFTRKEPIIPLGIASMIMQALVWPICTRASTGAAVRSKRARRSGCWSAC